MYYVLCFLLNMNSDIINISEVLSTIKCINVPIAYIVEHLDDFKGAFELKNMTISSVDTVELQNSSFGVYIIYLFEKWYISADKFTDGIITKRLLYQHFNKFSDAFDLAVKFIIS